MALDRYLLMVVAAVLVLVEDVGRDGDRGSGGGGGSLRGTQRGREGKWEGEGGSWRRGLGEGLAYGCWL